jgi:multiple sugar transport system substrate-binding protein
LPESRSDVPLLYWATDANPARGPQMATFEKWMVRHGYPTVDLELDSNNTGTMKIIIQAASGVGGHIIDVYGGQQLRQYAAAGVILDVTEMAKEYGYGLDKTYASVHDEITVEGRQYSFPCNVTGWPITVNRALLEREGLPLPKFDWTWDEFLEWCQAVTKVENGRVTRFAIMPGNHDSWNQFRAHRLWATNGGTIFNETMTKCIADNPRNLEATQFYYDLMFKHNVVPTPVDMAAQASAGGWGGSAPRWVGNGLAVGLVVGRWGLIQLRQFEDFKPDVALLPYKVMPMQVVTSRSAAINAGAANPELIARFQQFLAGPDYNRLIVHDVDALPPNPRYARGSEFLYPADHPEEHGAHEKYYRAVAEYGVGDEYSPFISPFVVTRLVIKYLSGVDSEAISIERALRELTDEMNLELRRTVERDPKLQPAYAEALALQEEIDKLKAAGKPVPIEWIANPIIRKLRGAGP